MEKNYYQSGGWNLICDVCSIKYKANKAKQRWDGFIVCPNCYEQRHPQDFVKTKQDKITVPYIRPINDSVYTTTNYLIYVDDGYWSPLNYTESVLY
jgi:hypothetical protein